MLWGRLGRAKHLGVRRLDAALACRDLSGPWLAATCRGLGLPRLVGALACRDLSGLWLAATYRGLGLPRLVAALACRDLSRPWLAATYRGFGLPRLVAALACRDLSRPWLAATCRGLGLPRLVAALACRDLSGPWLAATCRGASPTADESAVEKAASSRRTPRCFAQRHRRSAPQGGAALARVIRIVRPETDIHAGLGHVRIRIEKQLLPPAGEHDHHRTQQAEQHGLANPRQV